MNPPQVYMCAPYGFYLPIQENKPGTRFWGWWNQREVYRKVDQVQYGNTLWGYRVSQLSKDPGKQCVHTERSALVPGRRQAAWQARWKCQNWHRRWQTARQSGPARLDTPLGKPTRGWLHGGPERFLVHSGEWVGERGTNCGKNLRSSSPPQARVRGCVWYAG